MIDQEVVVLNSAKSVKNPSLEKPSIALFVGGTGSGKSTYMMSYLMALQSHNKFKRALLMTSNKVDPILSHFGEKVKISNNPLDLTEFIDEIRSSIKSTPDKKRPKNKSIIIFDDCQGSDLINIKSNAELNGFALSHRHFQTWMVFCLQTFRNSISTAIRKQASLLFVFPPRNEMEEHAILEEVPVNRPLVKRSLAIVKTEPFTPLYINLQENKPKLFRGFKESIDDLL